MESKLSWKERTNYESKAENWRLREQLDPALKEKWTKFITPYKNKLISLKIENRQL